MHLSVLMQALVVVSALRPVTQHVLVLLFRP